jgi:hypothetical protein
MSIYDKSVDALTPEDLAHLLEDGAVENVRLEFKRDKPGRDETLKKLSSFANTFGGYLVVGADAPSTDGKLVGLPGIEPQPNYKQKIVQWCHDGAAPPLQVFVSDGIPTPSNLDRACYVIYVPESQEAPHFLNFRKGVFIRTDEFSQRFEPQLATYSEIVHLANRRQAARDRRERLLNRSLDRFATFAQLDLPGYAKGRQNLGSTMEVSMCPLFPSTPLSDESQLRQIIRDTSLKWRQVGFPRSHDDIAQHESILIPRAAGGFSLFELTVWGHLFYAYEIERESNDYSGIHLSALVGHLLVFLEHGRKVYHVLGYDGLLEIRVSLKRIRGQHWVYFDAFGFGELGPASKLDDEVTIRLELPTNRLTADRDDVAADLLKSILFALNWPDAAHEEASITAILARGYKYNLWE